MIRGLITGLFILLSSTAFAIESEPTVHINQNGFIEGHIDLPATKAEVRFLLSDAVEASKLSSDVYDASSQKSGTCEIIHRKVRGVWSPMTYQARRCPTDTGWIEELVKSDTLVAYHMEWTLLGLKDGTRVGYKIRTEINYPLPQSWVQSETKRSVIKMLKKLLSKFAFKKKKKK